LLFILFGYLPPDIKYGAEVVGLKLESPLAMVLHSLSQDTQVRRDRNQRGGTVIRKQHPRAKNHEVVSEIHGLDCRLTVQGRPILQLGCNFEDISTVPLDLIQVDADSVMLPKLLDAVQEVNMKLSYLFSPLYHFSSFVSSFH
jgi:hypothetical protein